MLGTCSQVAVAGWRHHGDARTPSWTMRCVVPWCHCLQLPGRSATGRSRHRHLRPGLAVMHATHQGPGRGVRMPPPVVRHRSRDPYACVMAEATHFPPTHPGCRPGCTRSPQRLTSTRRGLRGIAHRALPSLSASPANLGDAPVSGPSSMCGTAPLATRASASGPACSDPPYPAIHAAPPPRHKPCDRWLCCDAQVPRPGRVLARRLHHGMPP